MPIRFQVDPDFYDHPKSIGMSDAATALWVRAGSYSAAKLLDGFIAEHVLSTLSRSPEEASAELVARGLWRRIRGGFLFHQYAERNLTKADVEQDREYERNRKRDRRAAEKAQVNGHSVPPGLPPGVPVVSHPDSAECPDGSVSVSVSVSESVLGGVGVPAGHETRPPPHCRKHPDGTTTPCRPCAAARNLAEAWDRGHAARKAARQRSAPRCQVPGHETEIAANCRLCAADAKGTP
jgi:hypothetical protein